MSQDLLPFGLLLKLLGGLALCFGALLACAALVKARWGRASSLASMLGRTPPPEGIEIVETRGLSQGSALHLVRVEGCRLLLLQGKERSEVLWTSEAPTGAATFDEAGTVPAPAPADLAPMLASIDRERELRRERQRRFRERRRKALAQAALLPFPRSQSRG